MQSRSRLTGFVSSLHAVYPNYESPALTCWPLLATFPSVSTNRHVGNEDKDLSLKTLLLQLGKTILNIMQTENVENGAKATGQDRTTTLVKKGFKTMKSKTDVLGHFSHELSNSRLLPARF